jgi:O-antigen/teichoic acid export membrane protein
LNIESGSIRFFVAAQEQGRADVAHGFMSFGRFVIIVASPLVMSCFVAAFLFGGGAPSPPYMLVLLVAAAIPVMGWLRFSGSVATAAGAPLQGSAPRTFVQPTIMLGVFLLTLLFFGAATPASAGASLLSAFIAAAAIQFLLLRAATKFQKGQAKNFGAWRDWLLNGFYLTPLILLQENLQYAAIFAASLGLGPSDVAVYAIAFRFVAIVRFGVLAVNVAASPKISRAMAQGDCLSRDATLRKIAPLRMVPAFVATALIILMARPLLELFGDAYVRGAPVLIWFILIPLSAAILGPNQMLLNIAGFRRSASAVSLASLIALVVATAYSGKAFGVAGAAAATALVYALWELSLFLLARAKLGVNASIFTSAR